MSRSRLFNPSSTTRRCAARAACRLVGAGARREHAEGDTGFHVEDARPVQPAVRARQRHAVELTDRPDGIEVAEQEDLRCATAACPERSRGEFGQQMIAAILSGEPCDAAADRRDPRRQLVAAAIDRGLVGRRRFDADEGFRGVEQPLPFGATERLQGFDHLLSTR